MARSRDGETGAVGSGFGEPASGATVFEDSTGFVNVIDKRGIIVCLCKGVVGRFIVCAVGPAGQPSLLYRGPADYSWAELIKRYGGTR